jgi:hypothetical protein
MASPKLVALLALVMAAAAQYDNAMPPAGAPAPMPMPIYEPPTTTMGAGAGGTYEVPVALFTLMPCEFLSYPFDHELYPATYDPCFGLELFPRGDRFFAYRASAELRTPDHLGPVACRARSL